MGIVYTFLGAAFLALLGLNVYAGFVVPEMRLFWTLVGASTVVWLLVAGITRLTKWADKTIEESK